MARVYDLYATGYEIMIMLCMYEYTEYTCHSMSNNPYVLVVVHMFKPR